MARSENRGKTQEAPRVGENRGDVRDTKKVDAQRRMLRVIVDENAGPGSPVWDEFQRAVVDRPAEDRNAGKQSGKRSAEYLFLKDAHPGIPDVEILDKLLGPDTILLTGDRPLHAQAIARGIRAYTLNELGQITRRPVARFHAASLPQSVHHELRSDYRYQPGSNRPEHLLIGLTDKEVKKYRSARRRIRAYFGAAAAISLKGSSEARAWGERMLEAFKAGKPFRVEPAKVE